VKNLQSRADITKEGLIGRHFDDAADLYVRATGRHVRTKGVQEIGLSVAQVGDGFLFDQLALAVVQIQLHLARDLRDENGWRRPHQIDDIQASRPRHTKADHPERKSRIRGRGHLRWCLLGLVGSSYSTE